MERICILLEKIKELNSKKDKTVIEIDLMLDYTRVLYADLLEWRNKVSFTNNISLTGNTAGIPPAFRDNKTEHINPVNNVQDNQSGLSFLPPLSTNTDIRQQIGINDKYLFISELFGDDKEAYEEIITEINTFETEEEANRWLSDTIYDQYGWKDEMEAMQLFRKSLSDFFSSK